MEISGLLRLARNDGSAVRHLTRVKPSSLQSSLPTP